MSGLLVNPVFVQRFFSDYGGADGSTAAVNPSITGISVACLQASAAVGALIAGRLGDIVGRKRTVRLGGIIYFLSAFIQIFAPGFATFIVGRTLQGFGVGFLSMVVPIIQTEIAAPHTRGLMVGIEYTCLIAGYMLSCWVDYGFHFLLPDHISWQGPFIIQIILSFILIVMSFFLPETPRWLASNGFTQECLQTVADLHSGGDTDAQHVQKVHFEIQEAVIYESELGKAGWMVSTPFRRVLDNTANAELFRKCSLDTASALSSESRFRCSPSSMESTSFRSISLRHCHPLASATRDHFSTPRQTPSLIQLPLL